MIAGAIPFAAQPHDQDTGRIRMANSKPAIVEFENVDKTFSSGRDGTRALAGLNLSIKQGEFFSIIGPSGCGKTTALRILAGFEAPTGGKVSLDGQDITTLPPYRRDINMVFQSYALFPHMDVQENIEYGLRRKGLPREERQKRVAEAINLVQLDSHVNRKPSQLSGGQQQRVALARALVNRPKLLLLDEPLAALDAKLRHVMQSELKRIQAELGLTFVFVTHDQREAFAMSDRVAIMNGGRLEQVGPPVALYRTPSSRFVADFVGHSNFLTGAVTRIGSQPALVSEPGCVVWLPADPQSQTCTLLVRPEHLTLRTSAAGLGESISRLRGVVAERTYLGAQVSFAVDCGNYGMITVECTGPAAPATNFIPGTEVWVTWDRDVTTIIPD